MEEPRCPHCHTPYNHGDVNDSCCDDAMLVDAIKGLEEIAGICPPDGPILAARMRVEEAGRIARETLEKVR